MSTLNLSSSNTGPKFSLEGKSIKNWVVGNGVADDRNAFQRALNESIGGRLIIDCPVFISILKDINKPIFIPSNVDLVFTKDGSIILDNKTIPALCFVHSQGVNFYNPTILWRGDSTSDIADYGTEGTTWRETKLKSYLETTHNVVFSGTTLNSLNPTVVCACLLFHGECDVNFYGLGTYGAEDDSEARFFMPVLASYSYRERPNTTLTNQVISSTTHVTARNIYFENSVINGVLMGHVENLNNVSFGKVRAYKYSDMQNASGTIAQWFAPPHLFYVSYDLLTQGVGLDLNNPDLIEDCIDYGIYVGGSRRRGSAGLPNSMKFGGNGRVKSYISYRPDGAGGDTPSGKFIIEYLYSEYDSRVATCKFTGSITGTTLTVDAIISGQIYVDMVLETAAAAMSGKILAFGTNGTTGTGGVGTYSLTASNTLASSTIWASLGQGNYNMLPLGANNIAHQKMHLVDIAPESVIPLFRVPTVANHFNDSVFDLTLEYNNIVGVKHHSIYLGGNRNTFKTKYILKSHAQTKDNVGFGVIEGNVTGLIKSSKFDIEVTGWRNILSNIANNRVRALIIGSSSDNSLSATNTMTIKDISNSHTRSIEGGINTETLILTNEITPTAGGTFTSTLVIPASLTGFNWQIESVTGKILTSFGTGAGLTSFDVGVSGTPALLLSFTNLTANALKVNTGAIVDSATARTVIITPNGGTFTGVGKLYVSVKLKVVLPAP